MTTTASSAVIRQWARDSGFAVGDRGRLSPDVLAAYAGRDTGGGAAASVLLADRADATEGPGTTEGSGSSRLRLSIRPTPGATGISRRVRARTS
jgi:hypothetical protein